MPDIFTQQKRSEVMSRIRSRGNKGTELALVRIFKQFHITGWRRHVLLKFRVPSSESRVVGKQRTTVAAQRPKASSNPQSAKCPSGRTNPKSREFRVRPDFIFQKERVAVLVDGCFWHGCPKHANLPVGNRAFWRKKLATNRARDRRVNRWLRRHGWRVVRLWEHELRHPERCLRKITHALEND